MRKESGRQLMDALVTFLSRNHHNVIIEGWKAKTIKNGCREWNGLPFRAITGRKSVLNNWLLTILPDKKKPGILRLFCIA